MQNHASEQEKWKSSQAWIAPRITIPSAGQSTVRREELISSLEAGDEELVIFRAAAGYGKTTTMAEWAQGHRERCCWYRLQESDNDPVRFLYGMAASFSHALSVDVFGSRQPARTKDVDFDDIRDRFFSGFLSALPDGGFSICLDDFQVLKSEAAQNLFLQFMEYGSGKIRFFVTVKGGFPEFLSVRMMQGRTREIVADELRFAQRETGLLLESIAGKKLSGRVKKSVQDDMRGWAAGIVFAGRALKKNGTLCDRTHLDHYIFHEIFRKLPVDTQQFLTDLSVFDKIEVPVCNYVLSRVDAGRMLEYLVRENLFLSRSSGEKPCYRYDGVFIGFLKGRLPEARFRTLLLRAAAYYVRHERWEEAARCGMRCGGQGCEIVAAAVQKCVSGVAACESQPLRMEWLDYLCEFREELAESALFFMYQCLRREKSAEKGMEILSEAAQKAYRKRHYETYAAYMCELMEYTEETRGPSEAQKVAEQAIRQLEGLTDASHPGMAALKKDESHPSMVTLGKDDPFLRKLLAKKSKPKPLLFVQCFGPLIVTGQGDALLWRTKKVKELFACLFFEEGRWVSRDILLERLWSEKPLDRAVVLFHTTVSYLRRNLAEKGAESLLLSKNRSYALDMAGAGSDMETFRKWYNRVKAGEMPEGENPGTLLELYRQGYMYGEDYLWLGAYQEEMERQYLWMLRTLAQAEMGKKNYVSAEEYLRKAAQVDEFDIEGRELLLECLIASGDIAGAKKEYGRLKSVYREVAGQDAPQDFSGYLKKVRKKCTGC